MMHSDDSRRVTRRTAINSGLAVAAGSLAVLGNPAEILGNSANYKEEIAHWQSLLCKQFRVAGRDYSGNRLVEQLKLVEVRSVEANDEHRPKHLRPHCLSLLFQASSKNVLASAGSKFEHSSIPTFELMISHTRDDRFGSAVLYEAVLN